MAIAGVQVLCCLAKTFSYRFFLGCLASASDAYSATFVLRHSLWLVDRRLCIPSQCPKHVYVYNRRRRKARCESTSLLSPILYLLYHRSFSYTNLSRVSPLVPSVPMLPTLQEFQLRSWNVQTLFRRILLSNSRQSCKQSNKNGQRENFRLQLRQISPTCSSSPPERPSFQRTRYDERLFCRC